MAERFISEEDMAYWADVRDRFLLQPNIAYLNGGIFGPCARVVVDRIAELSEQLNADVGKHMGQTLGPLTETAREKLAAFVGAHPDRIALVLNTTMGMNLVAQGLTFEAGGEILMSDHEYPSMEALWRYVAERDGLTIRKIALPITAERREDIVDAFAAGMNGRTRLITFCHVYYFTGLITPARALCGLARENGTVSVVDGAHAIGMVNLDLSDMGCDFYVNSCHKWLLGPKGTGMVYIDEVFQNKLRPLFIVDDLGPRPTARRYDIQGTRDQTHFAALGTAVDFMHEVGWPEKVQSYGYGLSRYLKERLQEIDGVRLAVPMSADTSGFMTAFIIDGVDLPEISRRLWDDYQIQNSCTQVNEVHYLRVSVHFFNTYDEVDRMIAALRDILSHIV
ncbi:MAG: aminotransferase class V-fold PLP-dependent enzyme [Gemmatimonadota bacterium]|nr:aminotransferase class V-fold PLP-dependent enzyme [Gemmatimonadota bacterium]